MSLQAVSPKVAAQSARPRKPVVSAPAREKVSVAATKDALRLSSTAAPAAKKDVSPGKWALAVLAVIPALGAAALHPFDVFSSKADGGFGGVWGLAKYMVGIE